MRPIHTHTLQKISQDPLICRFQQFSVSNIEKTFKLNSFHLSYSEIWKYRLNLRVTISGAKFIYTLKSDGPFQGLNCLVSLRLNMILLFDAPSRCPVCFCGLYLYVIAVRTINTDSFSYFANISHDTFFCTCKRSSVSGCHGPGGGL